MGVLDKEIKKLQSRIDVTYEEAEKTLIRCEGNVDKAYYSILRKQESILIKITNYILNIFKYSIMVKRKKIILIDLPLYIFIILLPVIGSVLNRFDDLAYVLVFLLFFIILSGCDLVLKHPNTTDFSFKKREVSNLVEKEIEDTIYEEETTEEAEISELEDGYNEISV